MKITEAISKVDALKPNTYSMEDKVDWLSALDFKVKSKIIDLHEQNEMVPFTGYDTDDDIDKDLLAPAPYDEMYLRWLEAQIDYYNGEEDRYNNSIILFNNAYEDYKKHYTRTHMPISRGKRFAF